MQRPPFRRRGYYKEYANKQSNNIFDDISVLIQNIAATEFQTIAVGE